MFAKKLFLSNNKIFSASFFEIFQLFNNNEEEKAFIKSSLSLIFSESRLKNFPVLFGSPCFFACNQDR